MQHAAVLRPTDTQTNMNSRGNILVIVTCDTYIYSQCNYLRSLCQSYVTCHHYSVFGHQFNDITEGAR